MMRWLISVLLLSFSIASFAVTTITDFNSEIKVQKDASLLVTERFTVDSDGTQIKHGIYRDFPVSYKTTGGINKRIGFKVIETTLNGKPTPYEDENIGRQIRVKLGDPNVTLSAGRYDFQISYKATQELGFFQDHDELYWNVTGNNWLFPILNVTATVVLPSDARISKTKAFTGAFNATEQNYTTTHSEWAAIFKTTAPLSPGEGLTVVVAWQKGVIAQPDAKQVVLNTFSYYQSVILLLIGFCALCIYYFVVWLIAKARRPRKRVIFPLFKPPEGFDAADLRVVMNKGFDDRAFTAAILSLASKGCLTIEHKDKNYTLIKKNGMKALSFAEERLFQDLFYKTDGVLTIDESNAERISAAIYNYKKKLNDELPKEYFVRSTKYYLIGVALTFLTLIISNPVNPLFFIFAAILGYPLLRRFTGVAIIFTSYKTWIFIGVFLLLVLPLFLSFFFAETIDVEDIIYYSIGFMIIIINIVFFYALNYYTQKGQSVVEHIQGFKMFLNATEKQRMAMASVPELTSDLFERYLPYAVAFDVEKNWSDQFAALLVKENYKPTWYVGSDFTSAGISSNFGRNLSTAMGAAIVTITTSAPGSSSGFGSGGSSGGGGGGGGGGGW